MAEKQFNKVLVANRGEIAIRVFRACYDLGLHTVAMYSNEDTFSLFRTKADEAYLIGENKSPLGAYLDIDGIIDLAKRRNVDAIHPGYGFLSENADFARACEEAGITFIGPSSKILAQMGDKLTAKAIAKACNVPTIPGSAEPLKDGEEALAKAKEYGFPIILKAAGGGGGRGIRKVEDPADAGKAFTEAHAEAEAAFGDGECYMEKFVSPAHHVEVQVLADAHGNVVSLGERECSVQRRNQKLVEESPAPCLDAHPGVRERMHKAARDLTRAVGYVGVGTIEFLFADDGSFYFMEMNTRLQVEHPVTEFVSGVDLVKWQLRVASGAELPFSADNIDARGHAIECRINAETPEFLPSCGEVTMLHVPGGPQVRFDSALYVGAVVPPYYDSLLGKLIVCSSTREEAIRKMRSALGELVVEGVAENSELHLDILSNPEFVSGNYHTNLMEHLYE